MLIIYIQLSRQSTPRCTSRQQQRNRQKHTNSQQISNQFIPEHSNASLESTTIYDDNGTEYWNEDDDFGADELQLGIGNGGKEW